MMSVAEESSASFEGSEFGGGIVSMDGNGVPEVRSEGVEEGFVDEAAEGQAVLREVSYELCWFEDVEHLVAGCQLIYVKEVLV